MKTSSVWAALGVMGASGLATNVFALSASTTLEVSATALEVCAVGTSTAVAFGGYVGDLLDGTGTVRVTCSEGASYVIALDSGINPEGGQRRMSNGSGVFLPYGLYTKAARDAADLWGDAGTAGATNSGQPLAGVGTGAEQAHTVYGRILGGETVPAGDYTDTVLVTVYY